MPKVSVDYSYDIKEFGRTTLEVDDLNEVTLQDELEKYIASIMEEGAEYKDVSVESYMEVK